MSILALVCAAQLGAAPPANVGVVLTRREGVTKSQAQVVVQATVDTLKEGGLSVAPPMDAGSCGTKRTCLVGLARRQQLEILVVLEVANVLDEGVLRAEAVSVDEDGKRVALVEYEGALGKAAPLRSALTKLVAPAHATLNAGKAAPVPTAPAVVVAPPTPAPAVDPAPAVVTPTPTPAPAGQPVGEPAAAQQPVAMAPAASNVSAAPTAASGSASLLVGVALLIAGGAGVAGSAVFGGLALAETGKVDALCPVRNRCSNLATANTFFDNAERWQTIGLVSMIAGGALAATGLVLILARPAKDSPSASVWLGSDGAGLSVTAPLNF